MVFLWPFGRCGGLSVAVVAFRSLWWPFGRCGGVRSLWWRSVAVVAFGRCGGLSVAVVAFGRCGGRINEAQKTNGKRMQKIVRK